MKTGRKYWRSLDQLAGTPQFREWIEREFPEGASELLEPASRRTLLKLMAASFGLAGLAACRRPVEKVLPASKGVEDYVPGNPLYYSTALTMGGVATGLVVETHDGRPTKIEGNPKHPSSLGACSAYAQASILGLYDPDRSRYVLNNGGRSDWEQFAAFARQHFTGDGADLRFLSERIGSPSMEAVKAHALQKFPKAKWVEFEPVTGDEAAEGAALAFGQPLRPQYRFENADVVVALDSDFLGLDAPSLVWTRDFARRRKPEAMNRLYAIESNYTITGAMADHRRHMRASGVRQFAIDLAKELNATGDPLKVPGASGDKWVAAVAKDLKNHRGRSLVLAGPRQPAIVHALAHLVNQQLGNAGNTVSYTAGVRGGEVAGIRELAGEMAAGRVNTLVILGGNPVYNAPADLDFEANLRKLPMSVHAGIEANETAAAAKWHLPEAHYLESWGDGRAWDGTASVQQPLIEPLFGGKTQAEIVALISGYKDQRAYDIVRGFWMAQWPQADRESKWRRALHDGVIPGTAFAEVKASVDVKRVAAAMAQLKPAAVGMEFVFYPSAGVHDGRFANNGWMQEAPDPMTKLTWDNAALVSPATAKSLGVDTGDIIAIGRGGRSVNAPILVQPGHADNSISLTLGYGRTRTGRVGRGVGFNAYRIRTTDGIGIAGAVQVRKTGRKYRLATTQEHHSMEGRPIVREATLEEYRKKPEFAKEAVEHPPLLSLFKEHSYDQGNQWGLAVDLNACIGCNSCLLACQAENNIPIVGKEQVLRGREMHWIRMDRYFTGGEDDPQVVYQPVACQQCENAPCESVCPVAATSHSPEGLNDMAYNRCVGTRYCANNCPYKVRRFNFLEWNKSVDEVQKMVFNPDVTVRVRGVMEKCTYCVQRIQEAKIRAKAESRRPIRDGEIQTACQQTCPAEAIVFGNINDPDSRVAKLQKENRAYVLLEELNVKPRTRYLAKVRNVNREIEA